MTPKKLDSLRYLLGDVIGFNAVDLCTPPNVVLERGGNVAVFEYESRGVYQGHYLFRNRKMTLTDAQDMLREMFSKDAEVIKGLTPLHNKAALYVTARLGFTDYGTIDTEKGPMRLSILTKKEFK